MCFSCFYIFSVFRLNFFIFRMFLVLVELFFLGIIVMPMMNIYRLNFLSHEENERYLNLKHNDLTYS